jgi:hypothetical protein
MLIGMDFFAIEAQACCPQLHLLSVRVDAREREGSGGQRDSSAVRRLQGEIV